jgi:hypothetical protein
MRRMSCLPQVHKQTCWASTRHCFHGLLGNWNTFAFNYINVKIVNKGNRNNRLTCCSVINWIVFLQNSYAESYPLNVSLSKNRTFETIIKVKWENRTNFHIREGDTIGILLWVCRRRGIWRLDTKVVIYKPEREASPQTDLAITLI